MPAEPASTGAGAGADDSDLLHLRLTDLVGGGRMAINPSSAVPFENEHFVGRVLFMVNAPGVRPEIAARFEGRRRRFWAQVQGRFKERNARPVFMGGEVPQEMVLGVLMRGVCK